MARFPRADGARLFPGQRPAASLGRAQRRERPLEGPAPRPRPCEPHRVGRPRVRRHRPVARGRRGSHQGHPRAAPPLLRRRKRQAPLGHAGAARSVAADRFPQRARRRLRLSHADDRRQAGLLCVRLGGPRGRRFPGQDRLAEGHRPLRLRRDARHQSRALWQHRDPLLPDGEGPRRRLLRRCLRQGHGRREVEAEPRRHQLRPQHADPDRGRRQAAVARPGLGHGGFGLRACKASIPPRASGSGGAGGRATRPRRRSARGWSISTAAGGASARPSIRPAPAT